MRTRTLSQRAIFVGKLTATPIRRRFFVGRWPGVLVSALLAGLSLFIPALATAAHPQWQPVAQIARAAEAFLETRTGVYAGDTEVRANPPDAR
ncbi:MAG TPA: hypothetical protein PKH39_10500, partial [Woeseiaceae bacterium]|nr:hypothetical protein [Woeseiaceae bacterium]